VRSWPGPCRYTYAVFVRYFGQENHQIYGEIRCIFGSGQPYACAFALPVVTLQGVLFFVMQHCGRCMWLHCRAFFFSLCPIAVGACALPAIMLLEAFLCCMVHEVPCDATQDWLKSYIYSLYSLYNLYSV